MKTRSKAAVVGVTLSCVVLTGCTGGSYSTTEQSTVGGAAVGALVGGLLGGWEWAAIGAASGAALGWVSGKAIEAQEVSSRSTVQDQQLYGYSAPSDSAWIETPGITSLKSLLSRWKVRPSMTATASAPTVTLLDEPTPLEIDRPRPELEMLLRRWLSPPSAAVSTSW